MFRLFIAFIFIYLYFVTIFLNYGLIDNELSIFLGCILISVIIFLVIIPGIWISFLYANILNKNNLFLFFYKNFIVYYFPLVTFSIILTDIGVLSLEPFLISFVLSFILQNANVINFLWEKRSHGFELVDATADKRLINKLSSDVALLYVGSLIGGLLIKMFFNII